MIEELQKLMNEEKGFNVTSNNGTLKVSKWGSKQKNYFLTFCKKNDNTHHRIGTIDNIELLKEFFEGK